MNVSIDNDSHFERGFNDFALNNLLNTLDEGTYFTLDPQAIVSLDILPKLRADLLPDTTNLTTSRSNTTVYSVLNKCRTTSGQRLLSVWLKHPLKDKEKIDLRLEIVKYFVDNTQLRSMCYDDYLKKIPDLMRISHKISKEKCSLGDLVKIYTACDSLRSLCKNFDHQNNISGAEPPNSVTKLFNWIQKSCDDLGEFMKLIEDTIDLDSEDAENNEYLIKPNSDEDIARVSLEISHLNAKAKLELAAAAEEIGLDVEKSIKLEISGEKGFNFKVTKLNEQLVRDNSSYEQHSLVKKDGYRFTNRILNKLSAKYVNAKEEYNQLAKNVIVDIVSKAGIFECEVLGFSMAITVIDTFISLSVAAVQNNYIKPLILDADAGKIVIDRLRHPCLENQPDVEDFVPNDIEMSKDDKKFYLITGPNMGGKSTFIKSVAVNVVMAQCGSMIPAEDARISVIDGVYTRIGAGDKQMEGISTFMEEMMDMSSILKAAGKNSFVIIDELGRGTSTFDGYGLAWAISKHLSTVTQCFTLFATHFHELTEMEEDIPIVGNLHVKAICQDDKLTMLYNVVSGVCDESYGINVAQYTKFPKHVVDVAKEKLKQFEEVPGFVSAKDVRQFVRECTRDYLSRSSSNQ